MLTEEEKNKILLSKEELDILGKTHALIYFAYDEYVICHYSNV